MPALESNQRESRGIVLAASGSAYVPLAVHAAKIMRQVMPDMPIDLYSDVEPPEPSVFDQVHALERTWFRPKFEALRRSRFDRTLYCDTDLVCLADISDIFDVLDRFDIVGAHSVRRASESSREMVDAILPMPFSMVNGGLLGVRRTERTQQAIARVEAMISEKSLPRDQGALRQVIWESDLRVWVLPPEYNLMTIRHVDTWGPKEAAPRILHLQRLHHHIRKKGTESQDIGKLVGRWRLARIDHMIRHDPSLADRRKLDLRQWLKGMAGLYPKVLDLHHAITTRG